MSKAKFVLGNTLVRENEPPERSCCISGVARKYLLVYFLAIIMAFSGVVGITTEVMGSTFGTEWVEQHTPIQGGDWSSVVYGNGLFVAVSRWGADGQQVMISPNGEDWALSNTPLPNQRWNSITFGNGIFVAVSDWSDISGHQVMTSVDGIDWTLQQTPISNQSWNDVVFGNGIFVAVSQWSADGRQAMTSPDGVEWTLRSTPGEGQRWNSVAYGDGNFVAIARSGDSENYRVMTSPDGMNWTLHWNRPMMNQVWSSITFRDDMFVAVSDAGFSGQQIITSSNGLSWTVRNTPGFHREWSSITYGDGIFMAVSRCRNTQNLQMMTSINGISWMLDDSMLSSRSLTSITFGGGMFVAVSNGEPISRQVVTFDLDNLRPVEPDPIPRTLGYMSVGETVRLELNGHITDFVIIQQGSPGLGYVGFEGITVVMPENDVEMRQMHTAPNNTYSQSAMHNWLNGEFLEWFDSDIRALIPQVRIPFSPWDGESPAVHIGTDGLLTRVFLPSLAEVGVPFGRWANMPHPEGVSFAFFSEGLSEEVFERFGDWWWLRSPVIDSTRDFWLVRDYGYAEIDSAVAINANIGVRPAVPLPSSLWVLDGGYLSVEPPPPVLNKLGNIPLGEMILLQFDGELQNFFVIQQGSPGVEYGGFHDATIVMPERVLMLGQMLDGENVNYRDSLMHSWLNSSFLEEFDDDIRNAMREVWVPYRPYRDWHEYVSTGLNARAFLLSAEEVGLRPSCNIGWDWCECCEGRMFDFFLPGTSDEAIQRRSAPNIPGIAWGWWLRTPDPFPCCEEFAYVNCCGELGYNSGSHGVRPAIALSTDLYVLENGVVVVR